MWKLTSGRELQRVQELDLVPEVFAKGHVEFLPMLDGASIPVR